MKQKNETKFKKMNILNGQLCLMKIQIIQMKSFKHEFDKLNYGV